MIWNIITAWLAAGAVLSYGLAGTTADGTLIVLGFVHLVLLYLWLEKTRNDK